MPRKRLPVARRDIPRGHGYVQDVASSGDVFKVQARWQESGTWRARTFTAISATEARDAAIDHLVDMHRARRDGRQVIPSMMTVGDLMDVYIDRSKAGWRGSTEHVYRAWSDRYIVARIGSVRLHDLRKARIQIWIDDLSRVLASRSVSNIVMLLRAALNHAVDLEMIAKNPARGTKVAQSAHVPHQIWTRAQVARVLDHVADDAFMNAFYRLALGAGLRPGELRALQWPDIDLTHNHVVVRRTATVTATGESVVGTRTKTGRDRTIALTPGVMTALQRWRVEQEPMLKRSPLRELRPFVFSTKADGTMTTDRAIRQRHNRTIELANVPKITLHGTRHCFATLAMESGAHPLIISIVLGHATVSQTLDTYSHPSTIMQREAMNTLESFAGGLPEVAVNEEDDPEEDAPARQHER